jgi:transcriptional regulator with XRE-family HTH domain
MSIGNRIRGARESAGLTQTALAQTLGLDVKNVSRWERQEVIPRTEVIVPLADALGVDVRWLLEGLADETQSATGTDGG